MLCCHQICRFTIAFCLLLRDTDAEYQWDRPHNFQTVLEATIAVMRLTLGDFGSQSYFHLSNARPLFTYSALLLFIFFVPIVLLNALIAIMVNIQRRARSCVWVYSLLNQKPAAKTACR